MIPFYFGNINYWKTLVSLNPIEFNVGTKIPKKSYVNRMIIATADGLQTLSIPLEGGRGNYLPFDKVQISYSERWQHKHKMAIISAYAKSPYFEYYGDTLLECYQEEEPSLITFNLKLHEKISKLLKISPQIVCTSSQATFPDSAFIPNEYATLEPYPQVFRNKYVFQSDLCILDALFNLGPKTKDYLLR